MDATITAAFVFAVILAIIALMFTVQFARGEWLLFVVGRDVFTDDESKLEAFRKTGKRIAFITAAFALLMLTIVWYKGAEIAGNDMLQTAGLYANNVMFLLFIVALIAFYAMQRIDKNKEAKLAKVDRSDVSGESARMARRMQKARVDSFPTATLIFLIVIAVAAFGMGMLFGSL